MSRVVGLSSFTETSSLVMPGRSQEMTKASSVSVKSTMKFPEIRGTVFLTVVLIYSGFGITETARDPISDRKESMVFPIDSKLNAYGVSDMVCILRMVFVRS